MSRVRSRRGAGVASVERAEHLIFEVNGQKFALPLLVVQQIVPLDGVARVAEAPRALQGAMTFGGELIPVVDLAAVFGGPNVAASGDRCAMIVGGAGSPRPTAVGLVVDAVNRVIGFAPEDIAPTERFGALLEVEFLGGMASVEQDPVAVLALGPLLDMGDIRAAVAHVVGR